MSVLNKMLRDLEKRQHVSQVAVTPLSARSDERPLWLNLLLLLSALLLAFAVYAILTREPALDSSEAVAAVNPAPTDNATTLPDKAAEPVASAGVTPVALQQSTPVVSTTAGRAETGIEEEAATDTVSEANTGTAADNALQSSVSAQHGSGPDTTVQTQTVATKQARPALPVANAVANTAARTEANAEAKTEVKVVRAAASPQQQAVLLQQQALAAAQAGQLQQALQLWQQLQQFAPQNAVAYLEQARLWHQLGQSQQALTVLQQALQQGIVNADIQLLLAQQAAAQAQWERVDTLLPAQFELVQQPDYFGLKATALQQLGQPQAALDWFSQLIVLQPQQARWWLGAAIAFDALAQPEQAQLHYRQALQWGDSLTAASRHYIQQRLAATE